MTMTTEPEDRLANAKEQGQAQFDSIVELVEALDTARKLEGTNENCDAYDQAEQTINEDALSVEVRSDWHIPGALEPRPAQEYRIVLCTGGPAVQIRGDLNEHFEPETARLEVQDWFMPWTEFRPRNAPSERRDGNDQDAEDILLTYARCFWFGE